MLIASILALCLLVVVLNALSKSAENDEDEEETFENKFQSTKAAKDLCPKIITNNETNIQWWKAMQAALKLDEQDALNQIAYAERAYEQGNRAQALEHLRKAFDWYQVYAFRLIHIYGPEPGVAPPVPVIKN